MARRSYYITDDGRKVRVPSVTTVLGLIGDKGGLMGWYFKSGKEAARLELEENAGPFNTVWDLPKSAAEIGTIAHAMVEAELSGVKFDRSMYSEELLAGADTAYSAWSRWKSANDIQPIATELSLSSQVHRFGGTFDLVAMSANGRVLADLKTGAIYPEHLRQIAGYKILWEEAHPEEPIDELALIGISKGDGGLHYHSWPADSGTMRTAERGFLVAVENYQIEQVLKKAVA